MYCNSKTFSDTRGKLYTSQKYHVEKQISLTAWVMLKNCDQGEISKQPHTFFQKTRRIENALRMAPDGHKFCKHYRLTLVLGHQISPRESNTLQQCNQNIERIVSECKLIHNV